MRKPKQKINIIELAVTEEESYLYFNHNLVAVGYRDIDPIAILIGIRDKYEIAPDCILRELYNAGEYLDDYYEIITDAPNYDEIEWSRTYERPRLD